MNNTMKLSRQDFLKQITATTLLASVAVRTDAWPSSSHAPLASSLKASAVEKKFVPVMVTPYTQNGKIDLNGLERLIDFYMAAGVRGFFANCLSS